MSALAWASSEEGQETISQVKSVYDSAQGVGSGGSSNTTTSGLKINGVPIGQIPVDQLVNELIKRENFLVPSHFAKASDIPVIPNASLFGALFSNKYPQLKGYSIPVKTVVLTWNKIRAELQNRGAATPGIEGGSAEENEKKGMEAIVSNETSRSR